LDGSPLAGIHRSVDKTRQSVTVDEVKFVCQFTERDGGWTGEYTGGDIGPVRVTAPTRMEALRKLEGEIRYWLELCPCTGQAYRDIEIEVVQAPTAG
jgi:hypothetical protein